MRCERDSSCNMPPGGGNAACPVPRLLWGAVLLLGAFVCAPGGSRAESGSDGAMPDSASAHPTYQLAPISVTADRVSPELKLREIPGQTSWLDVQPFQMEITNTASILDRLPGLHIQNFGSIGHVATASIRGTSASQITVYLDGVPLTRAGAGLMNLAELPFAGVHHVEVYRGFAPATLPGASMGGAINLVSAAGLPMIAKGQAGVRTESRIRLGAGSFDTRRFGLTQRISGKEWDALVVADALQSAGDFEFLDDNGTDWNPADDGLAVRENNWLRTQELLVKLSVPLAATRLTLSNQWVDRKEGLAGRYDDQETNARLGLTHNLTNVHLQLPAVSQDRLSTSLRFYYDWRQDSFLDPAGKISLVKQDIQDQTQDSGAQVFLESRLPVVQTVTVLGHARQETFDPIRPREPAKEVQQSRSVIELALGNRWSTPTGRLAIHGTLRLLKETDHLTDDLAGPFAAPSGDVESSTRQLAEPHVGVRVRLLRGLFAEASYGEYHRSPTFMELFGDKGNVRGNPQLQTEEGINRDIGLQWSARRGRLRWDLEAAHFRNYIDHFIVFARQSQRLFIARNIGAARMEGEEYAWSLGFTDHHTRVNLQGNVTRQRTRDLGVDQSWYANKQLPGRPAVQAFAIISAGWRRYDIAWQIESVGLNYLDRFNLYSVAQRTRQGADAGVRIGNVRLKAAVRNLTDNRDVDARDYPLPGRTYSFMTEVSF